MPTTQSEADHVRSLLLRAFTEAEIPAQSELTPTSRFTGSYTYWLDARDADIEVVFCSAQIGSGQITCSIRIAKIATRMCELFSNDDAAAISALVDVLK
jgi:hypothetical protein